MKFLSFIITLIIISWGNIANARVDCSDFISKLPSDFHSGYVTVPEDWNNPNSNKIDVFFYGRKDLQQIRPTIAFFNGGPSSSSHNSFAVIESHDESKNINFIYIDQRGTGCSDPYPAGNTVETAKRLTNYTTRSIVKDAEKIRERILGKNSKWKIFGQSYGGMIVHRYLSMFPESIITAHVHGYAIMTDQNEWMKLRILSQKRVSEDYFKAYPNDQTDLQKIKNLLGNDYCLSDNDISLCGPVIMDILRHPLGFSDSWNEMHWWIENIANFITTEPNMMLGFSNFYYTDFTHDSLPSLVINKVEISKGPSDREECIEAFKRLKAEGNDPNLWDINECRVIINLENKQFDNVLSSVQVSDPLTLDSVKLALVNHPEVKLYLYSGQKDVFVPVDTFVEEAQMLKGLIQYTNFQDSGHEGFNTEQLIWDELI